MLNVAHIITPDHIILSFNKESHTIRRDQKGADKIIQALKTKDYDAIPNLVSLALQVETFSHGDFQVKNGAIFIDDFEVPEFLSQKILSFMEQDLPHEPLIAFAKKLGENPSNRSVQQLYTFLEKNNHPITDSGNFIAYKKVRDNWFDCHSGTFDNSPGKVIKMPRNQVDENPNQTCSHGLHVANWSYAHSFYAGGKMLQVEVNPKDVVAVPTDYNNAKMRVCEYKVIGEVSEASTSPLHRDVTEPSRVASAEDYSEDEDEDEDEYYDLEDDGGNEDEFSGEEEEPGIYAVESDVCCASNSKMRSCQ
jgi:hypothetical protein